MEYLKDKVEIAEGGEILVLLSHPKILSKSQIGTYEAVLNFHPGLPWYRGRHPIQWMLIDGVKEMPVSVHYVDEGIDTGNILVHTTVPVDLNETYATALEKVANLAGPMVLEALGKVGEPGQPQPEGRYVRRRTPEDSKIPIPLPSIESHRLINAMSDPMPNIEWNGVRYVKSVIEDGEQIVTCAYRI